jgi:hypothetical protein
MTKKTFKSVYGSFFLDHSKKVNIYQLLIIFLLSLASVTHSLGGVSLMDETIPEGQAYGVVAEVFGANITALKFELHTSFKVGDHLEITYMAGMTPILLGLFEVASLRGELVVTRPVRMISDPQVGMQVIALIREPSEKEKPVQKSITNERPPTLDVSGMGTEPNARSMEELERSSRMETMAAGPVTGKVVEVLGSDISVSIPKGSEKAVRPGQIVELFYVTGSGQELFVGKWKVASVGKALLKASRYEAVGKPKVGLKAIIRTGDT